MAERVLDIVAEDPQEQHVAAEVKDVGMHEGVRNVGQVFRNDNQFRRQLDRIERDRRDIAEPVGGSRVKLLGTRYGDQEDDDIGRDQSDRDVLQLDALEAVGVVERNEHGLPFRLPLRPSGSSPEPITRRRFRCH